MIFQKLNKVFLYFTLIFFSFSMGLAEAAIKGKEDKKTQAVAAPQGTPTRAIQGIEARMDKYHSGKNLTAQQKAENRRLKQEIMRGTFDIRELSRQALGRHWKGLSPEQRSSFVDLMTQLLETKALFSKEHSKTRGKAYTVKYKGDEFSNNHNRAISRTMIHVPEKNVRLEMDYSLKRVGQDWKIYDVNADGASLVKNYAYQFEEIIKKNGYSDLVKRMQNKLNELKAKRAAGGG